MNETKPNERNPDKLYHYTSLEGLKGILTERKIWATSIGYLNDASEFEYLFDQLINKVLPEFFVDDPNQLELYRHALVNDRSVDFGKATFVTCFCERGDLLSQWRGYGGNSGMGVALGIDKEDLEKFLGDPNRPCPPPDINYISGKATCELQKCSYDLKEQQEQLRRLLSETLGDNGFPNQLGGMLLRTICNREAARFKHPSFYEEKEWRIVHRGPLCGNDLEFRTGRSMLIPYVKIDIVGLLPNGLKEIVVGPTPHSKESKMSLRTFLNKLEFDGVEITESAIPFREL